MVFNDGGVASKSGLAERWRVCGYSVAASGGVYTRFVEMVRSGADEVLGKGVCGGEDWET